MYSNRESQPIYGRPITKRSNFKSYVVNSGQNQTFCGFCKRNGESEKVYYSHTTKDVNGKVICPQLQKHVCELCEATGEDAHTRSYCPFAQMGRTDPFFSSMFHPSSGGQTFSNMVVLKKTRVNSAGKVRRYYK